MITAALERSIITLASLARRRGKREAEVTDTEPEGFVIGKTMSFGDLGGAAGLPVVLTEEDRVKHCLLLGQSGCGKSTVFYRAQDYDRSIGRTFVALSFRSDATRRTLTRLMAAGFPPEMVDLLDFGDEDHVTPLDFLGSGKGDPFARAATTREVAQAESADFGVQVMSDAQLATTACAINRFGITELERFLSPQGSGFRAALRPKLPGFLKDALDAYQSLSEDQMRGRAAALANKFSPAIFTPYLQAVFGIPRMPDLGSILDSPGRAVVVNLAEGEQPASGLLGRLILGDIQRHALSRVDTPEEQLNPFTLYLDEFHNIASESFATVLCESRKYKLAAFVGHQHFSQVPPLIRDSERINIFSQMYFSTSSIDARDIASEVTSSLSRQEVKDTVISLPVGRMLFVQRGKPTRLAQAPDSKDPKVDPTRLAEYRAAIIARTAIPRVEAEALLERRRAEIMAMSGEVEIVHERCPGNKGVRRGKA